MYSRRIPTVIAWLEAPPRPAAFWHLIGTTSIAGCRPEAAYGCGRNTQKFSTNYGAYGQQANLNQVTGGIVANLPAVAKWKLSPYLLAEGGALIFNPTGNAYGTASGSSQRQTRGAFAYGGGLNFPIAKRISLRAEYRGLAFSAPNFQISTLGRGTLTHTAQPSAGIVFRF